MLRTDALLGDFETVTSVAKRDDGELLRLSARGAPSLLVFVPESEERGAREAEMLALLRYRGIPVCSRSIASSTGAAALVFEEAGDARPLSQIHDFPEPTLRAGLTSLLAAINFVHSRGIVHRRIDRTQILADASGQFWLIGWADARPVPNAPPVAGALTPVAADLHDLARAFSEALLRRPWPDPESASVHARGPRTAAGMELLDAGVKIDRDCARVLSRLVTSDPRDAYTGATDVLADLGATAMTAFDPWENVRAIGIRREITRVLRLLEHTRLPTSETVTHASSLDYVGPSGAGKSRLLVEIARAARAQNAMVLTAEGGARGVWGGVGALCRQLVQLLGRGARMCVQHEDAIRHLLGDTDSAPAREPQPRTTGVDGGDPLISACTAAMTDLVRMAFRQSPGLLLLDDEEHLPRAARDVWRSTGHFVQAVNGGGGVLHALLVSTSTRSYPAELGAERITVELRPWRHRDVDKFLARAFASPAGARDASLAIHRVAGGRPGDVVGYLRELERAGTLRREGLRWRLDAPLPSLPPLAGGASDRIRRSLDAAGRDAALLVECLAVSRDVPLSRGALADLSDLHGPRLAAAADAALASGLVVADGAAWRVRTDAIAHKVLAALSAERSRVLHREVLNVLLETTPLETHPSAIHALARHARASADPRADPWTRAAVSRAQSEGEWLLALEHLDDAAGRLDGWFAGDESLVLRSTVLLALGRLGDVIESLQSRHWTNYESTHLGVAALGLLAQSYYEARDWNRLLELPTPEISGEPDTLARLRFLRSASMRHLGRSEMSARESRLAAAEVALTPSIGVQLARLECEYQNANYAYNWSGARASLVAKLRLYARQKLRDRVAMDLAKLGNAARYLARDLSLSHAILVRGIGVTRSGLYVGSQARSALHGALAYTSATRGLHRRAFRHFSKHAFHAIQTGASSLATAARLRLIACAVASGRARYEDKVYIQTVVESESAGPSMAVVSACVDLGMGLLYYGRQAQLERLASNIDAALGEDRRSSVLHGFALVGQMWLGETLESPRLDTWDRTSARQLIKRLLALRVGDLWIESVVYCATQTAWKDDDWLRSIVDRMLPRLSRRNSYPGWGNAAAALALALWIPIEYDLRLWRALVSSVRRHGGPLPMALEWQRVLMEGRESRRDGDWRRAEVLRMAGETQLRVWLQSDRDARGDAAFDRWSARLGLNTAASDSPAGLPATSGTGSSARAPVASAEVLAKWLPNSWVDVLAATPRARRLVVTSRHVRELEVLACAVVGTDERDALLIRQFGALSRRPGKSFELIVIHAPEIWSSARVLEVRDFLCRETTCTTAVTTLMSVSLAEFRALGPAQRALAEVVDGQFRALEPICADREFRLSMIQAVLARAGLSVEVRSSIQNELLAYEWPGGLAELERLAQELAELPDSAKPGDLLHRVGWRLRVASSRSGLTLATAAIVELLRQNSELSVSAVAASTRRPVRTTLRLVNGLVAAGALVRQGRGRATRYRLSGALQGGAGLTTRTPSG